MEFRHLQTLQAIAQEGNFVKAAEKLQYTQSMITLHIHQLEAELGVKLFARRGKRTLMLHQRVGLCPAEGVCIPFPRSKFVIS